MASMTFKEVQRLQGVQRGSKASKALTSIEVVDHEERYPGSTTKKKWRDREGCCRNATPFRMVLQMCNSVDARGTTACGTATQRDTTSCW